jgi:hypothetical protein
MRKYTIWGLVWVIAGCSTSSYRSAPDPNSALGRTELSDKSSGGNGPTALVYGVLDEVLKEPRKSRLIWGQCRVRSQSTSNIYTPCNNIEICLVTEEGKEVASTRIEEGHFSFNVEVKKVYRLALKSTRYKLPTDRIGPFTGGDGVTIDLNPAN